VIARKLGRTANPYPSIIFLTAEAEMVSDAAGLPRGPMGYFAGRSAPMGAVSAEVVVATFYNFQPDLIRSCIPAAWSYTTPADLLGHRLAGVDVALRRVLGDEVISGPQMAEAARLARIAAEACAPEGRALFAGHASLPWPREPHLDLWHSLTLLREHRGDGHIIALQVAGYSGCEALLMHVAVGGVPRAFVRTRAWSAEQWAAAADSLRARGLIDADEVATEAGRAHREAVEAQTDLLAVGPLEALGEEGSLRLRELVRPWSVAIAADIFPQTAR
jgi:helix-turn-helix protein